MIIVLVFAGTLTLGGAVAVRCPAVQKKDWHSVR
jgi:hypothetical protein